MAKISGRNAAVYVGGNVISQANQWSINVTRELSEARVFSGTTAADSWTDQIGGVRSWSGSINAYYDDSDESIVTVSANATARQPLYLYETRADTGTYWYGFAWFDMDESTSVDDVITLNMSFTGDGALTRVVA